MKKQVVIGLFLFFSYLIANAQSEVKVDNGFPPTTWISKNTKDEVTIHNDSGAALKIDITVSNKGFNPAGINVNHCGTTTHIGPGSSAICVTSDPSSPVSFSSDSVNPNEVATGTYVIKLQ